MTREEKDLTAKEIISFIKTKTISLEDALDIHTTVNRFLFNEAKLVDSKLVD